VVHCLILPNRSFCLSVEPLQRCVSSNFFACEVKWEQFHPIFTHLPAEHGVALSQTSTSAPWSWARARSDQASVDDKRVGHIFRGRLDRTKCTREQGRRKRVRKEIRPPPSWREALYLTPPPSVFAGYTSEIFGRPPLLGRCSRVLLLRVRPRFYPGIALENE